MKQRVRDSIRAHNEVDFWNAEHKIGDRVIVRTGTGPTLHTTTRSGAYLTAKGHAVIELEGVAGYFFLDRVEPE